MKPKIERVRSLLRERGIDGAIASSPENFHYVAGYAGHQHTVSRIPGYSFAVFGADDASPAYAATMDFEVPTFQKKENLLKTLKYDSWVGARTKDVMLSENPAPLPDKRIDSMDLLVSTIKEMGLEEKTIGVECSYLPVHYYNTLSQRLPNAKLVDISDLFVYARSVKTDEEITMFRTLCRVADSALLEMSRIVKVGVSERELAACFRKSVWDSGICVPSSWSMISAGESASRLTLPGDGVAQDGDTVKFDGGVNAEFDFYTTDTSRTWLVGNADPALCRMKDRVYEAQRRMIDAVRPGVPIKDIYFTGFNWVKEKYPNYTRGHTGHSISMGPSTAEAPIISSSEERLLEPGMILALEVPCYMTGSAGFNIEDMVLVTETGCEVLTPMTPHYL